MVVYVVMKGERSEGGRVLGVWQRKEDAVRWCKEYVEKDNNGRYWQDVDMVWDSRWVQIEDDEWEGGCDWMDIKTWEVE